jgi:uncharacterized small protein (DUF1192 family)
VLASPAFSAWTRGEPLDVPRLIGVGAAPRGTILYLAHLADRERLSFLTLFLSALLSWTRSQPGSESLRVLLYLDEIQGILPPSAMPPTKPPLLTLLKQGRAFGTGVLLATQNPVDLDYKALGNIGIKLVGRLDTDNDRRHALQGLDVAGADATVAGLKPREFLLAGARAGTTRTIGSRWAISYLRGPLTLAELKPLAAAGPAPSPPAASAAAPAPLVAGVAQLFGPGASLSPHVLVEAEVIYRKSTPPVERRITGEWAAPLGIDRIAWESLIPLADVELVGTAPAGSRLASLPGNAGALLKAAGKEFLGEIDSRALEVAWHRGLKLVQQEGESAEAFATRCAAAAGDSKAVTTMRTKYEAKLRRIDEKLGRERLELERDRDDLAARERQSTLTVASGVGEALLGTLLGRRRSLGGALRKGASTAKQYSEKQRMAGRAKADVEESEQAIAALQAERERLEAELAAELERLQGEASAGGIEVLRLTPARKDIAVRRVALAWLPREGGA